MHRYGFRSHRAAWETIEPAHAWAAEATGLAVRRPARPDCFVRRRRKRQPPVYLAMQPDVTAGWLNEAIAACVLSGEIINRYPVASHQPFRCAPLPGGSPWP